MANFWNFYMVFKTDFSFKFFCLETKEPKLPHFSYNSI